MRAVPRARRALAATPFTATSGAPGCRFASGDGALAVRATLDSSPQPFQRFEREVVEYAQGVIWFHLGARAYPREITHMGLDADWLPSRRELLTTDGVRLVDIVVGAAPAGARERVAEALARTYLVASRDPFHSGH